MIIHNPIISGSIQFPADSDGNQITLKVTNGVLETVQLDSSGDATATIPRSNLSGSFSGSFIGDGSNLTGVSAINIDALTSLGGATIAQGDNLVISDAGTEKKITFSNLEDSVFGNISGDVVIAAGGVATIQANSVVLTTDTTGDYVGTITGGTGVESTAATSGEGTTHTLSVSNSYLNTSLNTETGSISTAQGVQDQRITAIETDSGSYLKTVDISGDTNLAVSDTSQVDMILTGDTLSANLKGGVISGSAQLLNVATDFGSGRISGELIGDVAGTSTITGSFVGDGTSLSGVTSYTNADNTTHLNSLSVISGSATQVRTLLNIEDGSDVTDTTNVTSAGALMDSEVTDLDGIKSLTVPNSTTISTFGATVVDDTTAGGVRTTIGVDAAGTDNSTNVTIAAGRDYVTISGQALTLGTVDISDDTNLAVSDTTEVNMILTGDTISAELIGGVVSGSSQITITEAQISDLSHYTNANVKTKLDAETVLSGSITSADITDVAAFSQSGTYSGLRAQSTTQGDVGLGNVTNESKSTMFSSPTFTGTVISTTPSSNDSSTKVATTAFVQTELTDLIGGAPAAYDTLLEISASIANGDSDVVALTTTVGTKLAKASNLSDLANASTARGNLGLAGGSSGQFLKHDGTFGTPSYTTNTNTTYSIQDGELSQINFTSADNTKLDAIEASATADQTAAQIRTLVGTGNSNFVPSAGTSGHFLKHDGTFGIPAYTTNTNTTYSIGDGGLTQINFTSADNTKLDAIESSATADQTAAEIRTLVGTGNNDFVPSVGTVGHFLKHDGTFGIPAYTTNTNTQLSTADVRGKISATGNSSYNSTTGVITSTDTNTTYSAGNSGLVPAAGTVGHFLKHDGTFGIPAYTTNTNTTYSIGDGGLTQINFTSADNTKLDAIESSATADQTAAEIRTLVGTGNNDFVPSVGTVGHFLKHDGTFGIPAYTTNTNTQLSTEAVEDIIGGMLVGTETGITVSYDDTNGEIDFVVATQSDVNFTSADHSKLDGIETSATADQTAAQIRTLVGTGNNDFVPSIGTSGHFLKHDGTFGIPAYTTNTNTTYSIGDGGLTQINFTSADNTKLDGIASSATATVDLTISGTGTVHANNYTDTTTNTQLSTEQVQDIVGGMLVGTETRVAVSYDDTNGRINFVVDDMTANTNTTTTADVKSALNANLGTLTLGDSDDVVVVPGNLTVTGTTTTNNVATVSTSNGVIFEGSVADDFEVTLLAGTVSADRTITLPDTTGTVALTSQLASVGDGGLTTNNFTTTLKNKLDAIEASATADQTAAQIRTLVGTGNNDFVPSIGTSGHFLKHDGTFGIPAYTTNTNTTYASSDFTHDDLIGFVGNEHIDWTSDQGATNLHANNYTDTNTTYSVGAGGLTQQNFTTTLKSKLDGIEASATADQTAADIGGLDITRVGTITSGVWNGTAITSANLDSDTAHLTTTQTFTGDKTFSKVLTVSQTTASTTKTTGALIVAGGAGIGGALNVGGDIVAFASSDERLKDNIEVISNPIEKVQQLKGVTWDWNSNADELQQTLPNVGVIAQDVEKVLPQLVIDRDNGFKGVDYAKLTGLLIEAIKEQQIQIEELKSKIS